jgi:hypothetical protein
LSTKVTPLGKAPVSLIAGAGDPVVVTVKLPSDPSKNEVLLMLVMIGAELTVMVTEDVVVLPAVLVTVRV